MVLVCCIDFKRGAKSAIEMSATSTVHCHSDTLAKRLEIEKVDGRMTMVHPDPGSAGNVE